MESFEVKQTFDRKQEASWEPEKFGLGPADTADLSKQYNTICLPLVEPEHFIEILQMTASTAKDIEALRAELARRMAELCVELKDMRSGPFQVAGQDTQLSDDDCTHIGKAFAGNSVALGSILKAVIKLLRYELRPESPFLYNPRMETGLSNRRKVDGNPTMQMVPGKTCPIDRGRGRNSTRCEKT